MKRFLSLILMAFAAILIPTPDTHHKSVAAVPSSAGGAEA
jgi:hypothetical protein